MTFALPICFLFFWLLPLPHNSDQNPQAKMKEPQPQSLLTEFGDKIINPRDRSAALLIKDGGGGGMDPDGIRCCMSFGFSEKKSKSAIGKYGNGFKTSSMRLGADVIVFTRRCDNKLMPVIYMNTKCSGRCRFTQSIGLLSYTFLTRTGLDRIVVPMVDYEFSRTTGKMEALLCHGKEHFQTNLAILLRWSPYSEVSSSLVKLKGTMHDRGDYMSGSQMEKEWDEADKSRKRNLTKGYSAWG
ncbi:hypothetical protein Droror1_Dr00003528 [Drosera rotundifolia]